MSVIDDIVNVQITRSTTSITRQGFGTMLVLVNEEDGVANKGFRVKTYGSFSDVADDWDETDFAYIAAQAYFGQTPSPDYMMVGIYDNGTTEADTSYADALDKVYDLDSSWYALIADTRDATEIENLADSVAAYERIYITSSSDSTILDSTDSTDIASVLSTASHDRTAVLYSTDEAEAPEAAWFVGCFRQIRAVLLGHSRALQPLVLILFQVLRQRQYSARMQTLTKPFLVLTLPGMAQ